MRSAAAAGIIHMTAMEELSKKLGELPEGRVLAGFSGGADSTALMFLLAAARDNGRIQPEAVHVNHGLRGAESDGDEAFCAGFCRELGIPGPAACIGVPDRFIPHGSHGQLLEEAGLSPARIAERIRGLAGRKDG